MHVLYTVFSNTLTQRHTHTQTHTHPWALSYSLIWYQRVGLSKRLTWQLISCVAHGNDCCHKSLPTRLRVARSIFWKVEFLCRVDLYWVFIDWCAGGGVIQMWKKNARKWSESCIAWIALTVSVARTVALSLKSSQMSRVNDVIYFHSLVWMWFVMWTVSKQIPVTSASYSMCWEANPASRAQRGVLDSSTDPGEDWTGTPLL